MKEIIIGVSKSNKKFPIGSWLIRIYMWSLFSHIYVRVPFKKYGKFPSDRIIHASEGLVQHMSATVFNKKHKTVEEFTFKITDDLWDKIKRYDLHEPAGENYGMLQNVGIALVGFLRIFGIRATNPFKSGWNCSEFVLKILKDIDYNKYKHLDGNLVTPKDLYKILKSHKNNSINN